MAIAREVASVTKLGVEVCPLYRLPLFLNFILVSVFRVNEVKSHNYA